MTTLIALNTKNTKKAIKAFTGLTARVRKVKGQNGITISFDYLTKNDKKAMDDFFANFNIVSSLMGKNYTPTLNGFSYDRLFAQEIVKTNETDSFSDYWANSVSQSVINHFKTGNFKVIDCRL